MIRAQNIIMLYAFDLCTSII